MQKILVVDDEPDILELVTARLVAKGFEVVSAMDGRSGLNKARQVGPDLIILDLMLPGLNGHEICMLLKRDDRYRQIPVIIFTAKPGDQDKQLAKQCGAEAYLCKPFDFDKMMEAIQTLLASSAKEPEDQKS